MKIRLKTLTPLWTGGVDGAMDRIHETGVIGALRWWYEAIVRGLGGNVCNPTSDNRRERCPQEGDVYCDVCQIFGATGQQRKFKVMSGEGKRLFNSPDSILIPSGRIHQTRRGAHAGGWYLMGKSIVGENIPMHITLLGPEDISEHLRLVLSLIDRHAAIGAKMSNGYGVVRFRENDRPIQLQIPGTLPRQQPPRDRALPDIRDFFFAKLRFREPENQNWWKSIQGIASIVDGYVAGDGKQIKLKRSQQSLRSLELVIGGSILPIAPAVRNWLHYKWDGGLDECQKYFLFGEARSVCPYCCQPGFRPDKKNSRRNWCPNCKRSFEKGKELPNLASKINVSYAYLLDDGKWEFRIWGWMPCRFPENVRLDRDKFLQDLKDALTNNTMWRWVFGGLDIVPELKEWHSLDCGQRDGLAYLKELLGSEEGGAS